MAGDQLGAYLRSGESRRDGFLDTAETLGYEVVPLMMAVGPSGGPCEEAAFLWLQEELVAQARAAAPLDAIFVNGHGAGCTTQSHDFDSRYVMALRDVVGSHAPIIMLTDYHANVSDALVEAVDMLLAYRTNPHVDVRERCVEAARLMHRLLQDECFFSHFVRLPMLTPQVSQLTAPGTPMGELMAHAEAMLDQGLASVSLWPGFALADVPHGGFGVMAVAASAEQARQAAMNLANRAWRMRDRFVPRLTSLDRALAVARSAPVRPVILADIADNPGGGGRGNTTFLLRALHEHGVREVQAALFFDPLVVSEAMAAGEGAEINVTFNQGSTDPLAQPWTVMARVVSLSGGRFVSMRGVNAGAVADLGPTCCLELDGLSVVVNSKRQQIFSDEALAHAGLDAARARVIVVKSRGHFRAGFAHLVPPERVYEIDLPGLTTANLAQCAWRYIRRPIWPIDPMPDEFVPREVTKQRGKR